MKALLLKLILCVVVLLAETVLVLFVAYWALKLFDYYNGVRPLMP